MSIIIDRRLNAKKKSTVNRQRFLRRYKGLVKEAVQDAVDQRSITDVDSGSDISIPRKDVSEPVFHHGRGGRVEQVHPGNKEFTTGDRFQRPQGGGGQGSGEGEASNSGSGEDDFIFSINREEFLEYLFEDLELPNLVRKELKDSTDFKLKRAGYTTAGSPDRLNVVRSLKAAHARRIALSGKERKEIRALKRQLREMEVSPERNDEVLRKELKDQIAALNKKLKRLPFIDEFDLKFNNLVKVPQPSSKAVMFCIMDVSGSMTREIKDIAKRFFLLLYLFLERNYEKIEVVFIRHHSEARECNEHDFFYARETGGTVVSSALTLTDEIVTERYSPDEWNIYVAQASDGDNWEADSAKCRNIIVDKLLPLTQYYSYVEITDRHHQNLWHEYKAIEKNHEGHFAMQQIRHAGEIYPVFRKLFEKKEGQNA
ncbi:YeaH/YhbH family protein [Endozoicomonas sp. 8E]|uniref:YeaH/YhbH family protein n=1 Tax=Endozoicomonas sp. 8E TaxID=3035692 RepID=UPI0029393763|nr:YeaH/YhbH family protein [Endozoicomonas sp. 8E]WOG26718.1 YeaH/YhbH family protein [Endozoicomonas sp. 8E]